MVNLARQSDGFELVYSLIKLGFDQSAVANFVDPLCIMQH